MNGNGFDSNQDPQHSLRWETRVTHSDPVCPADSCGTLLSPAAPPVIPVVVHQRAALQEDCLAETCPVASCLQFRFELCFTG